MDNDRPPTSTPHDTAERLVVGGDARVLWRGFTLACGVCGRRGLFRKWIHMVDDCPRCGLHFERVEGHWVGAIGMNTVVTFGLIILSLVGFLVATAPDPPTGWWIALIGVAFGIVPVVLYPQSKTLWTAVDVLMRPPGPDEVRPHDQWDPPPKTLS